MLLIGPSGSGKSAYAQGNFAMDEIISFDDLIHDTTNGTGEPPDNDAVCERQRQLVVARLSAGHRAVVDACHLTAAERLANVFLVPADMVVEYIVIDRSLEEKRASGAWRLESDIIEVTAADFAANLDEILSGDGLPNVTVTVPPLGGRSTVGAASAEEFPPTADQQAA